MSNLSDLINEILYRIDGIQIAGFSLYESVINLGNIEQYIKNVENAYNEKENIFNSKEYIENKTNLINIVGELNKNRNKYKFLRNFFNE